MTFLKAMEVSLALGLAAVFLTACQGGEGGFSEQGAGLELAQTEANPQGSEVTSDQVDNRLENEGLAMSPIAKEEKEQLRFIVNDSSMLGNDQFDFFRYGLISGTGKTIMPLRYSWIWKIDENIYGVERIGREGKKAEKLYVDRNGKRIKLDGDGDMDYQSIVKLGKGYCLASFLNSTVEIRRTEDFSLVKRIEFGGERRIFLEGTINDNKYLLLFSYEISETEADYKAEAGEGYGEEGLYERPYRLQVYDFEALLRDGSLNLCFEQTSEQGFTNSNISYLGDGEFLRIENDSKEKATLYDDRGRELISAGRYLDIAGMHLGRRRVGVWQNGNWLYGYLDENGQELIPCRYSEAYDFDQNFAIVKENDVYSIIDLQGQASFSDAKVLRLGSGTVEEEGEGEFICSPDGKMLYDFSAIKENGWVYEWLNFNQILFIESEPKMGTYAEKRSGVYNVKHDRWDIAMENDHLRIYAQEDGDIELRMYEEGYRAETRVYQYERNYIVLKKTNGLYDLYNSDGKLLYENLNELFACNGEYVLLRSGFDYGVIDGKGRWLFNESALKHLKFE